MKPLIVMLFLVPMFCFDVTAGAQNRSTDEQARKLATTVVAMATNIPGSQLNTKRREDLEADLFGFQTKIVGHIQKAAHFYSVVEGGYQFTPNEVTYSPPANQWLVAVSATGDRTYGLEGFAKGEESFNELVTDASGKIRIVAEAEIFTRFYLTAVYGNADSVVYEELRLRHKAEEHFVGYSDSQEPIARMEKRFRTWWTAFKAEGPARLAPDTKIEPGEQYRVTVNVLEMTVGRPPVLWRWSIEVHGNGATKLLAKQPIFPARGKSR